MASTTTVLPVRELGLVGYIGAALFVLLAIASYSSHDPGFSMAFSTSEVQNLVGAGGAWFADLVFFLLGGPAWLLPLALVLAGIRLVRHRQEPLAWGQVTIRLVGWLVFLLSSCVLLHMHFVPPATLPEGFGGILGRWLTELGLPLLGLLGLTGLATFLVLVGAQISLGFSWIDVAERAGQGLHFLARWLGDVRARRADERALAGEALATEPAVTRRSRRSGARSSAAVDASGETVADCADEMTTDGPGRPDAGAVPVVRVPTTIRKPSVAPKRPAANRARKGTEGGLPDLDLLDEPRSEDQGGYSEASLQEMSRRLESKLLDFGVEAEVVSVLPGPVVTRFELSPAPGVKVQKISALAKDLARSLAVISVRIVEVIPNKPYVGIEIPNENRAVVRLKEILASEAFQGSRSPLTLALGKDIGGETVVADVGKMPHLLVAGTTGSGKSVGINSMILSLLYKATPEDVRLILVDPKMLELSIYEGIPHLLTPVVTDMKDAAQALNWCVAEMDRRYRLMASLKVRQLASFNTKIREAEAAGESITDPLWPADSGLEAPPLTPLPYIVVVIDEFADMMMIVGKKVETLIARIAQKARAAGIHLILATQRPSVDVITGLIKSNIPTRMSFQVSSKTDSRTVMDQGGSEQLLGHGDMLFLQPGTAVPTRVHGAFVSDDEVQRIVDAWKERGEPDYSIDVIGGGAGFDDGGFGADGSGSGGAEQEDSLYDEAVAFVLESRRSSISSVQRQFRIGYNRAARLIEAMEEAGVVSPPGTNGSREVLVPKHD